MADGSIADFFFDAVSYPICGEKTMGLLLVFPLIAVVFLS
jgi:hypothetical protein